MSVCVQYGNVAVRFDQFCPYVYEYQKSGVMLMTLLPAGVRQPDLFYAARNNDALTLMTVVDRINST